jgi:hypothetical protein
MTIDAQLRELYRNNWDNLCQAIPTGSGMSNPLLAAVPHEYESSNKRLLVVGQETHGWGFWDKGLPPNPDQAVELLRGAYCLFQRGRHHNSAFFRAAARLQGAINPASDPFGFMWLNLFHCDQGLTTPQEPTAESLRQASLLRREIEILKPDAVIFFTGPNYDYTLKHEKYFPKAEIKPRSKWWAEVIAPEVLPNKAARSYHPNYPHFKPHIDEVLGEIAQWITQSDETH